MRLIKALLALVLVVGIVGAGGYAAGLVLPHRQSATAAAPLPADHPAPSESSSPSTDPTPTSAPTRTPTPDAPSPSSAPGRGVLRRGDTGPQVRELQQRLHQLSWLPETTTGVYDANTVAALRGFQGKRGLDQTGRLDRRTWSRLVGMTERPTHDAMFNVLHPGPTLFGSGDHGADVRGLQARLKQLDWYFDDVSGTYDADTETSVQGFQGKREIPVTGLVDQRTLDRLVAMTTTPSHDELHNIVPSPGKLDARCRTGRVLCIDKTSSTLRWVVDGHVLQTLDARFGSTLNDTPTREGVFHVYLKDTDHVSHLYGSSMPFAMFFSGGQAVHYSSDFAAVGYAGASHGCVNIRDYDGITWLFSQVRVGDRVVVYWS